MLLAAIVTTLHNLGKAKVMQRLLMACLCHRLLHNAWLKQPFSAVGRCNL